MVRFFKQETVPYAAFALAGVSMFSKHPDKEYLGYVDFRTLAILCCLMSVMAELQKSSMLTPIGNPQNLYLYGKAGLSLGNFVLLMLPYASVALAVILVWGLVQSRAYHGPVQVSFSEGAKISGSKVQLVLYAVLFVFSLLTEARAIPYGVTLGMTIAVLLMMDRSVFGRMDYSLLLIFVGFFIFIGNIGRIPAFSQMLQQSSLGMRSWLAATPAR